MAYLTSGRNKIMGSSVSTDANVVTVIDDTCTDEQVPSALATKAYVDNKEVKISTEENNKIEIKDDGIFVSKDYVEITQAEYDLLTEEEKEDIVFYIKDATGNTELVTVIDENSTDEQVPSAKAVHTAIQNVSVGGVTTDVYSKTEVDDLLADKADSSDIIDAYTKGEVDTLLNTKADSSAIVDAYTKTEVDGLLANKVDTDDLVDAYSKTEVDDLLANKANTSAIIDAYTKTEVDTLLTGKADSSAIIDAYTKTEVNDLLDSKADSSSIIDAYNKTEVDDLLADKVNVDDLVETYSKTEIDGLLADKADSTDIIDSYTKDEVDNLLNAKVDTDDVVDAYSKEEVNTLLTGKADTSAIVDAYSKTEVDGLLANKVDTDDLVDSYTKTEVDDLLANKANTSAIIDAYTKGEVDTLLTGKADSDDLNNVYTKEEVNDLLDGKVGTDDVIDAYTKTEVDGLLANKANTTVLDGKLDKTAIVTSVSSTSTDEEIPSAKSVYTALQNVSGGATTDVYNKEEVDNLLDTKADTTALNNYVTNSSLTSTLSNYADIPSVSETFNNFSTFIDSTYATKTSVATNTANIASNTNKINNLYNNGNILINGAFQVNDYNVTSVPSTNTSVVYLTNRWATTSKGLSCSVSTSEHYLRVQASSGCTGLSVFQIIENRDITYSGVPLTLSFYIRGVGTGVGKTVTGRIGSGGGNTGETRVTLTDSWQYVTSTRTDTYFGSKSDGGVIIYSYDITDVGAGFDISCVKLEIGTLATLFAQRSDVEELELCQRYYQRWNGISHTDVPLGNFSVGTGDICTILHLPTTMRTSPSIKSTLTDVELYGCNTARTDYEAHEPTHLSIYSMSNNVVTLRCRSNGTFAVGSAGIFRIKFGQQYKFILDAELYS